MKKIAQINIVLLLALFVGFQSNAQSLFSSYNNMNNVVSHEAVIYPNPVTDLNFKVKSDDLIVSVEVINVIGRTINQQLNEYRSFDDLHIKLNECEKGMYLVKITFDDNKSIIKKMLIK